MKLIIEQSHYVNGKWGLQFIRLFKTTDQERKREFFEKCFYLLEFEVLDGPTNKSSFVKRVYFFDYPFFTLGVAENEVNEINLFSLKSYLHWADDPNYVGDPSTYTQEQKTFIRNERKLLNE